MASLVLRGLAVGLLSLLVPHSAGGAPRVCAGPGMVPGTVLHGPRLTSVAVAPDSGHIFVLIGNDQPGCAASGVATVDARGRILAITPLPGMAALSPQALALDPAAHLVLAASGRDVSLLDSRTGRLRRVVALGQTTGAIAVDAPAYRAFVQLAYDPSRGGAAVAVLAVTRGAVLRRIETGTRAILVDPARKHVFLLADGLATMIDPSGRVQIRTALPAGYHQYTSAGLLERSGRLLVAEAGMAPPHAGVPNPPNTLSVLDTSTGAVLSTIEAGHGLPVGQVVVDEPASLALSWGTNTVSTEAGLLDVRGVAQGTVRLPLPPGGFYGPWLVEPRTGVIYGFAGRGIWAVHPGSWQAKLLGGVRILELALAFDTRTEALVSLQWDWPHMDRVRLLVPPPGWR